MTDAFAQDFRLGNLAAELLEYTLDMCNKDVTGTPRFPARLYDSYVNRIADLALDILSGIHAANAVRDDADIRKRHRESVLGKCGAMAKLVFIAFKKGWISDKQNTTWQKKINTVYFVAMKWK